MNEIPFKTVPCKLDTGSKAYYRCVIPTNGSVDMQTLCDRAAARAGMNPSKLRFCTERLADKVKEELVAGNRVNLEDFFQVSLSVKGVFDSLNEKWNAAKHKLATNIQTKSALAALFAGATGKNTTEGAKASIRRIADTIAKTEGVITNSEGVEVFITGLNLRINTAAADEGVMLLDKAGTIVAKATILESTDTVLAVKFATLPLAEEGDYVLLVATRGGYDETYGVSMARKAVKLVAAE